MAISVNWGTKVITIPQSYLSFVSGALYTLDTDQLRLDLKDLEDDETGMPYLDTHRHNTETNLGGVIYARTFEIINGYTITFEDGMYRVSLTGSNNNIADVTNINQVSVQTNNSAGLQTVISGSGVTEQDKIDIAGVVWNSNTESFTTTSTFGVFIKKLLTKTQKIYLD